ncbi:hypothetical protein Ga0061061_11720 [Chelatococcus sambhunathii]|uniref:Uncharacterized protein n=1 Tax=Chelatococcus sambhunathii TaxID=363953 RepID=A0ABM9U9N6_9HYPH|nr:hypothetical protein [Chelatococcus sambhunathii]CUA90963.1 hypothetical protein Ga0061061_11720 [Chelatococcus sambhunathii]
MSPRITIRVGAAYDEVVVDGHTFDRSGLSRHQRQAMASLIVDTMFPNRRHAERPRHRSKAGFRQRRSRR